MKRFYTIAIMFFCVLAASAQKNIVEEIEKYTFGGGSVSITQPQRLRDLMGVMIETHGKPLQTEGYRVVVYTGDNSAAARAEAEAMSKYMKENYPGNEVYVVFESPIRACLYGDYRTREEAEAVMYRFRKTKKFKEVSIRRCNINIPYIDILKQDGR